VLRRAERGREVVRTIRPRGIFGLIRERAPLSIILYAASREGRLVWQGSDAFALLEPPRGERVTGRPGGLLRLVGKRWDLMLFMGPPALSLVVAALMVLLGLTWHWYAAWLIGLLLPALAALYVTVLMAATTCYMTVRWILDLPVRGRQERWAAGEMSFHYWSMPLCHCGDATAAPALLGQVTERLRALVRAQVVRAAGDLGARTETVEVNRPLLCLLDGATTGAMLETITATAGASTAGVTFLATGSASDVEIPKTANPAPGLGLYLLAVAVIVAVQAYLLAGWERVECAPDCAGRPASYGTALRWLAWRLIGGNPADVVPATTQGWVLGWLNTILGILAVLLFVVTMRRAAVMQRERMDNFRKEMRPVLGTSTVLIMVATPEEKQAVIEAVTGLTGTTPQRHNLGFHTAFELGIVSRARVLLAQTQPGSTNPGGAALTAQSLISQLNPDYLLLTGICFGLREGKQRLGDILVCTQLRITDHKKIVEPTPGTPVEIPRGERVAPSVTLLDRCQNARLTQVGPKIHYGPLLSGNVLLNSPTARRRMIEAEPDAIGGEMEGLGVYAAAAKDKVDWIVVKAICDWGMAKDDDWHERAARNAADFVLDVLRTGGLDQPPHRS
jgi:nucleoside phosphorylase